MMGDFRPVSPLTTSLSPFLGALIHLRLMMMMVMLKKKKMMMMMMMMIIIIIPP